MIDESKLEAILERLRVKNGEMDFKHLQNEMFNGDLDLYKDHVRILRMKGLIVLENPTYQSLFALTPHGWTFQGFEAERKEIAEKKRLEQEQVKSVIDTNKSVRRTNLLTLAFALVSTLFIAATTWMQYRDTTPQQLERLSQELKNLRQSLQGIELSQKSQDSSMKIFVERSLNKDTVRK